MVKLNIKEKSGGVTIECRVTPRASRNAIKGVRDGTLELALTSPPIEGRANKMLIELLSRRLGVRKSAVSIAGGQHSRNKVVFVEGLTAAEVKKRLSDV
jgi:uncharacterized protein (TIGR00251 family)